ncbi:triosephosphate isomerase (TIM) [Pancytospora epiphaga]|nr:triosephosphate isomerase (TIM) [Pancytospora epiphaga]
MKKKLIGGNWKLMCDKETLNMTKRLNNNDFTNVDAFIAVPALYLPIAQNMFPSDIALAAQDLSEYKSGPYTGEISARMLKDMGVVYVLVGHSERRINFGESCEKVAKKLQRCLENGLKPVLCIGESEKCRNRGEYLEFLKSQLKESLGSVRDSNIDIAYEPVWAIGKNEMASEIKIKEVAENIQKWMEELRLRGRIIYGGAVNKDNVGKIAKIELIDGVLVGGASLTEEFSEISKTLGDSANR